VIRRVLTGPAVAGLAAALTLAGCGGQTHRQNVNSHQHHHHHGKHHHHHGKAGTAGIAHEVIGTPTFAPLQAGRPGRRQFAITLPSPTSQLNPPSDPTSADAGRAFSKQITSAKSGAVVHLNSGNYPTFTDSVKRDGWVTVSGEGDATPPVIDSVRIRGGSHVRFVDVEFAGSIRLGHLARGGGNALHPSDVQILNSVIDCGAGGTQQGKVGIKVAGASQNVTLSGDLIEHCVVGFTSAAAANYAKNITLTHCTFKSIYGDAIDLGGIDGMEIANNLINGVHRTAGHHHYHDDGIQFFGNTANIVIAYNVEANSTDQLIFIQDAIKNKYNGSSTNQDILVLGNLLYGAGALAVQDQGGLNVQFIGNTIWDTHDGALLVRRSPYSHIVPTHTLVADNVIEKFGLFRVKKIVQGYNVFGTAHVRGKADVVRAHPGFTDSGAGVYSLDSSSPAKGSAAPQSSLQAMARQAGANAAALTLIGSYDAADRGSPIVGTAPSGFGKPDMMFGTGQGKKHHTSSN
jgi:hypothetical protein